MPILYSTDNCPWCSLLKKRLDFAKIQYIENKDEEIIKEKGFTTVPQLELPTGETFSFQEAINWVNSQPSNI